MPDTTAVRCVNSPCKTPYKCLYSNTVAEYVCCKTFGYSSLSTWPRRRPGVGNSVAAANYPGRRILQPKNLRNRQCPDGTRPLMSPATKQPMTCSVARGCPNKFYKCMKGLCCRNANVQQDFVPRCEDGFVEVYNEKKDKIECGEFSFLWKRQKNL